MENVDVVGKNGAAVVDRVLTKERALGTSKRWRRIAEPVPAGASLKADGTPDYGLYGPGSVAWEVILHPLTIFLETGCQGLFQMTYKPIKAGLRDHDLMARKAHAGTMTFFDAFERFQRNAGMHAPMWLGDTKTAQTMADHLHRFHKHVASDVIDSVEPELGGYSATEPRDAMWAALTEIHPILRMYEAFAFRDLRDGWFPRRLPKEKRDQYIAESVPYVRLVGANEDEIPRSMAELNALYKKYEALFRHSSTMDISPRTGQNIMELQTEVMKKNWHISQLRALLPILVGVALLKYPILGALPAKARENDGFGPAKSAAAVASRYLVLPFMWLVQQPPIERRWMRLTWGPDAVNLIESARKLHAKAKANAR